MQLNHATSSSGFFRFFPSRDKLRLKSGKAERVQTVYAHRDDGYMAPWSRWKPRKVFCTTHPDYLDRPEVEYVVKFRQGSAGAAALISEVVCSELLEAGGLIVLQRRLVSVSPTFAASYVSSDIAYKVEPGLHYGTARRHDVENGPPQNTRILVDPQHIIDILVFDTWLCNIDRDVEGNLLMYPHQNGRVHLIASDQSDCFCGAGMFADGTWRSAFPKKDLAPAPPVYTQAMLDCGLHAFSISISKVKRAAVKVGTAIKQVPNEWWAEARIDPRHVDEALCERANRISEIVNVSRWGDLQKAIGGGYVL